MSVVCEVDVVIVGGGLAGLAAGLELKKRGYSFAILEANKHVGGRVRGYEISPDLLVDLGAQWISKEQRRIKRLLDQFGLQTFATYKKGKSVYNFKNKVSMSNFPPVGAAGILAMFSLTKKLNQLAKEVNVHYPWQLNGKKSYDLLTLETLVDQSINNQLAKDYYRYLMEELACARLTELSALDALWYIKTAGSVQKVYKAEALSVAEGVATLVKKMSEVLKDTIYLQHPVEEITYENRSCFVSTSNRKTWKGKKAIIAIPLQLQSAIYFKPTLPLLRIKLVEAAKLPAVTKVVLIYKTPFWRKRGLNGIIHSEAGIVRQTVDTSPATGKFGILTVLITGEMALNIQGKINYKQQLVKELISYFGSEAGYPLQISEQSWKEERWVGGGYGVHFSPNVLSSYGAALLAPIASLHWAGTETATEWRLFMEGALQSGERAAQEAIEKLGKES